MGIMKKEMREAFRDSLNIFPGYIVLGIGFGVLMDSKGYGLLPSLLSSLFIYAGSMQYVGVDLLSEGASLITAFFMTVMVNIRHLFYGVGMLERYKDLKRHRAYDIFALTDETFSLACNKDMRGLDPSYYFYLSAFDHCWWVTGTVLGSIVGDILPFDYTGIDFSMTALFIVIVVEQWRSGKDHLPVILTFLISGLCLVLFGRDDFLMPAMAMIVGMLFVLRKIRGEGDA